MNRTTPGHEPDEPRPPSPPSSQVRSGTLYALDDSPDTAPPSQPARGARITVIGTALLVALGLAIPGVAAFLLRPAPTTPAPAAPTANTPPLPEVRPPALTGPVRVCVLKFRNLSGDTSLTPLELALSEAVVTDVGDQPGMRLIERGQLDLPMEEQDFTQGARVDPETRARLGRIVGAEVVVLGGFQQAGGVLRIAARFVHVETGEVLDTARVEGPVSNSFAVQDALAAEVRALLPRLPGRLRP
ncbi:CsgG/HfaB family protein [Myxococcus qinghaiensis]|uniref:CsgG/HfaB family protein n=1 Tax=Myxococcus qinghaiensis TaxID=2906758 RepID=UPI0020A809EB|nr:CsgG/HfaB family protein [Myxococcus qinghaiensis]MCP3162119.1 CsgG/HfaB family protein [Myxococcus qinghaiensis]